MEAQITIEYGDIQTVAADCIVNAANSGLREGSGVCGAIFAAAGREEMTRACRAIGRCAVGSAAATPGFRLPAKWVIHAVGPYTSLPDAPEKLRSAYRSALDIAREKGCRTAAFPLISSGVFNDAPMDYRRCGAARSPPSAAGRRITRTARWTCASSATAAA